MRGQSIPVTGLPGPKQKVFTAYIVITEQECVTNLEEWRPEGDESIASRLHGLLKEIVAERNKSAA
jgi:hypothetical protein